MRPIQPAALAILALAACSTGSATPAPPAHPAVIELYQSQGCSSCPPALAVLDQLANRPDVIALNFAVTYWDQLGWKDRFAQPAFTARQWDYARAAHRGNVATPQLIVNGRQAVNGGQRAQVEATIRSAARQGPEPAITTANGALSVGAGPATTARVWLVGYDPRRIAVPIRAGENDGRTLVHTDIVRTLTPLGTWTGKPARYPLPATAPGLKRAVLVQQGTGGPIVAAARL